MKIIKPTHRQPPNVVQFACSMEMTKFDVAQYLEKIYNIPVMHVRTRINLGRFKRNIGGRYIIKEDDTKMAYITLVSKYLSNSQFYKHLQETLVTISRLKTYTLRQTFFFPGYAKVNNVTYECL